MSATVNRTELFWKKVDKNGPGGCWLWTGFLNHDGYGRVGPQRGVHTGMRAHRMAWMLANGEVPKGMYVMHTCDVPACVRPDHLRIGTQKDNMADCLAKGRYVTGERTYNAKLNAEKVREMRRLRAETDLSFYKLAPMFGVSYSVARDVCQGRTWSHVK